LISPKKSLGQNFLTDPNTARKIAASLRVPDGVHVVEIGPGTGAMTEILAGHYPDMTAIEIDERAVAVLRDRLPALDVRRQDVLEVDWAALARERAGPLYVIGNLPYYITSPILFGLLDAHRDVAEAVLMMQLEVAARIVAVPRTKAYGILSVVIQRYAQPELLFRVSRNVFYPKPDVTSAVLRLGFHGGGVDPHEGVEASFFREVVRAAFNQRRKTLRNSLHAWTKDRGIDLPEAWASARAEELDPETFVELAQYLAARQ
jgi:16S rRNA (adenine1518-N6/adenine1519-N6)-dimethyltransferase